MFTIETRRVSIADSCTFHLITCRNATNHCPRASFPLIHGSRGLQRHYSPLEDIVCKLRNIVANVLWRNDQTISISINIRSFIISDRRQSKTLWKIDDRGSQIAGNSVFDCRLSPVGRQTAVESSVSSDLGPRSSIALTFSTASYLKCLFNIGLLNT